jgi:hypothetical protein
VISDSGRSQSGVQLGATGRANPFPLELGHLSVAAAESAGIGHLAKDDVAPLDCDEEMIAFTDVEHAAGLGGDHNPPEIVDLASYPRVHAAEPTDRWEASVGYRHPR